MLRSIDEADSIYPASTETRIRDVLVVSGIAKAAIDGINPAYDTQIHDEINLESSEKIEKFGSEDSYWTIYRMFCAGDRAGKAILTLEQVWDILAKNYDMSEETLDSLYATLHHFAADMNTDAKDRGLIGQFCEIEPDVFSFGLAPSPPPSPIQLSSDSKSATPQPAQTKLDPVVGSPLPPSVVRPAIKTVSPEVASSSLDKHFEVTSWIKGVLYEAGSEGLRQSDLRKIMTRQYQEIDEETTLAIIDEMAASEDLFKYCPKPGAPKWVTLDQTTAESYRGVRIHPESDTPLVHEQAEQETLDVTLAQEIVHWLLVNHEHVNQRTSSTALNKRLQDQGINCDRSTLNSALRRLADAGLLVIDQGTPTAGRRKQMSKSKSRQVMRVGLGSQIIKDELRTARDKTDFAMIITKHVAAASGSNPKQMK